MKNRLSVEATRLPCRVVKVIQGAYTLLSQNGLIKGRHQGHLLKLVLLDEDFGIPLEIAANAKPITLLKAVTLANNRKSISAL